METSQTQLESSNRTFSTNCYLDQVFIYSGQSYGNAGIEALKNLNKLARADQLNLCMRHTSNRTVKMILPVNIECPIDIETINHTRPSSSHINLLENQNYQTFYSILTKWL